MDRELDGFDVVQVYRLLDGPIEQSFEDVVDAVRDILHVPISTISLIDGSRQWFLSRRGLEVAEVERSQAFSYHAGHSGEPFVVTNAIEDDRFKSNPYVAGDPGIRFYIGVPIPAADGRSIGMLCAIDTCARPALQSEVKTLQFLAGQLGQLFELRRLRFELADIKTSLEAA